MNQPLVSAKRRWNLNRDTKWPWVLAIDSAGLTFSPIVFSSFSTCFAWLLHGFKRVLQGIKFNAQKTSLTLAKWRP